MRLVAARIQFGEKKKRDSQNVVAEYLSRLENKGIVEECIPIYENFLDEHVFQVSGSTLP